MYRLILLILLTLHFSCLAAEGKLLATPGVMQVEGSGGGGIVPWAQLSGYASRNEITFSGFCSRADITDYRLDVCGVQANLYDRVEISYAQQNFDVPALSTEIEQEIVGVKTRLTGDIVYSAWPQISLGLQYKKLDDPTIAYLVGAEEDSDLEIYVAASKLHLGGIAGYNLFWNLTARHTEANQLGLLGFGGPQQENSLKLEFSTAVFLNRHVAIGLEHRDKPDNLGLGEDDWSDIFVAWFPNKHINVTAAWLELGSIAGASDQRGWYLSISGAF